MHGKTAEMLTDEEIKEIDVVCFGHFNVLHPGHFRFLEFAANQGKNLCVILKGDDDFEENEKQYYFSEEERRASLANVRSVHYIVKQGGKSLRECLEIIRPNKFVLGHEFEIERDLSTDEAINYITASGGDALFHSGGKSFNSFLLDQSTVNSKAIVKQRSFLKACYRQHIDFDKLLDIVSRFHTVHSLVVGDLIIDQFISCDALGLSSEAPVIVVKELEASEFIGGAGVVAAHVASLGGQCSFVSAHGDDEAGKNALKRLDDYEITGHLITDSSRPTTYKTRYMVGTQKVFRVSRLMDHDLNAAIEARVISKLEALIPKMDNIIVSDFVYGVVTPKVLDKITSLAKNHNVKIFGDLQCSSQVGDVLRFVGFDMIFPTETEARIATHNKDDGLEFVAQKVFAKSRCKHLVIKLGSNGMIVYSRISDNFIEREHFPALSANPVDVSGAGDSMLASMALSISAGASVMEASAIGSLVANCAVEVVGNVAIDKNTLIAKIKQLQQPIMS